MPWWVKLLLVVMTLPVLSLPWLLAKAPEENTEALWLLRLYPVAIVLAAWCGWKAYGQRPEVTWVLIAVMFLTNAAMWVLV